ncbi:MAG: zinc ribbon domain-containing protein, partial [Anaerolineales bacterium]|nr:zinc ribbon domain-containing protein [Anaerolineales bacterium]
ALLIGVAFFVLQPFLEQRALREKRVTEVEALNAEREALLIALRDLDFDHATGKITTEDYAPQRAELVARGVAVLKRLDELGASAPASLDDEIEQAIARRRARAAQRKGESGVTCAKCGAALDAGDRFCSNCGARVATAAQTGAAR